MKFCADRPSTLTAQRRGGCMKDVSVSLPSRHHPSSDSSATWQLLSKSGSCWHTAHWTLSIGDVPTGKHWGVCWKKNKTGLRREALRSKLCIRQHCCMKRKKRGKKKNTPLLSCLIFITCTYKSKGTGSGGKWNCGNIAVCWTGGWCDGATENKRAGKASSFCILWLFVVNQRTVSRCVVSVFDWAKTVAGGWNRDPLSGPPVRLYLWQ